MLFHFVKAWNERGGWWIWCDCYYYLHWQWYAIHLPRWWLICSTSLNTLFIHLWLVFCSRWKVKLHLHVCWQVLSQSGKAQELTNSHRPYGRNKVSLQEIKRIREAGGWVCYSFLFLILLHCFSCIHIYIISLWIVLPSETESKSITCSSIFLNLTDT